MGYHRNKIALYLVYLIYVIHYFAKHNIVSYHGLLSSYLGDLLCMPIVLSVTYSIMTWLKIPGFVKITRFQIFGATFLFSFYFEWLLPNRYHLGTADFYDVLFYFIGAIAYSFYFKPTSKIVNKNKVVA